MVRTGGSCIITIMAAVASIWCRIIIAVVARRAIVRNSRMRPI